jgi:hypothetical protein
MARLLAAGATLLVALSAVGCDTGQRTIFLKNQDSVPYTVVYLGEGPADPKLLPAEGGGSLTGGFLRDDSVVEIQSASCEPLATITIGNAKSILITIEGGTPHMGSASGVVGVSEHLANATCPPTAS